MSKDIFCFDFVESRFTLLSVLPFRNDLRYCFDLTLLARNKTAFVNEFKRAVCIVFSNMNCRFPFSLSVNVASILPSTMAQIMQGDNCTVTQMRIFIANLLFFLVQWTFKQHQYCFPWKDCFYLKNDHQNNQGSIAWHSKCCKGSYII